MQSIRALFIAVVIFCPSLFPAQAAACAAIHSEKCHPLQPLLANHAADYPMVAQVLANSERFKVQILYTQIDRQPDSMVTFTHYQYALDEQRYFYPASTVKLPVSLLALQWLEQQNLPGLTRDTVMLSDSSRPAQTKALADDSAVNKLPSIGHYIKKILLVSDNDAYNRLYELLGQDYINDQLMRMGLTNTVINHRLSVPLAEVEQRHYNPVRFVDPDNKVVLALPARNSDKRYVNKPSPLLGKAHFANGKLVPEPMDFSEKNRFSVVDYNGVLKRIFFPETFSAEQKFTISEQNREFIMRYMSLAPSVSRYPDYDVNEYPDNYAKFLLVGGEAEPIPSHLKVFDKTGWAYGHAIDGAYIADTEHNVEFLLVAVIYANENDTLNDDNYQLNEIAKPFMRQLGQLIYQHELQRPRELAPDLTHFKNLSE
ncbi:serine hydrolase [Arsukibacterium sp.]|uniref:serine hydrolase n=1 Tax=Arsukibacterium sp. TaxID=1977258 RepID=UPI001BD44F27|nr:serine hydrolase [Arsukibacterium sp.]